MNNFGWDLPPGVSHNDPHFDAADEPEISEEDALERAKELCINDAQIWGNMPQRIKKQYIKDAYEELEDEWYDGE